jgi:hypothetical protein
MFNNEGEPRLLTPEELKEIGLEPGDKVKYTHPTDGEFEGFEKGVPEGTDPYVGEIEKIELVSGVGVQIYIKFPSASAIIDKKYLKKVS